MFPAYAPSTSKSGEREGEQNPWKTSFTSFPKATVEEIVSENEIELEEESGLSVENTNHSEEVCDSRSRHEEDARSRRKKKSKVLKAKRERRSKERKTKKRRKDRSPERNRHVKLKESKNTVHISDGQVFSKFNPKLIFSDGTGLPPEEAFRLDPKPERNNLIFDRPQPKFTPRFRSKIWHPLGFDLESTQGTRRRAERYFSSKISSSDLAPSGGETVHFPSFAQLEETNPLRIYDASTSAYIIGASPPPPQPIKDEETTVRQQVRDFNRALSKNPKDVKLWLKYVDFQEKVVSFESDTGKRRKANETYLAEKRISILDKAIEELPNEVVLLIKKLHIGETIWTNEELRLKWLEALRLHPTNLQLLNSYFEFIEGFSDFKVSDVLGGYRRCILKVKNLLRTLEGKRKLDVELGLKDIFFRLCIYLKNVGYMEKAVGLYQMQLELAVRTPPDMKNNPFPILLEMVDRFWDSHVPRLGEEGSQPWTSVLTNPDVRHRRTISGLDTEEEILKSNSSKSKKWLLIESSREKTQWLPWTPTEEEDEVEDKDRYVPLEDLKPFLFEVSNPSVAADLVIDFLRLLGCFDRTHKPAACGTYSLALLCSTIIPNSYRTQAYSAEELLLSEGADCTIVHFVHTLVTQCLPFFDLPEKITLLKFWLRFETLKLTYMEKWPERCSKYLKDLKKKVKKFIALEGVRDKLQFGSLFQDLSALS